MNEIDLKALRKLSQDPSLSQRMLAKELGLSLGKVNYVLSALMEKGYVKMQSFRRSENKLAYMYVLTPSGIRKKMELTYQFLQRKSEEYESLKHEIHELAREIEKFEQISDEET